MITTVEKSTIINDISINSDVDAKTMVSIGLFKINQSVLSKKKNLMSSQASCSTILFDQ